MMRAIYSCATWLMQPLVRRKLRRRAVAEPLYGEQMDERFGHYTQPAPTGEGPLVWLHAVSLGETRAAVALLKELRLALPGMRLLLTHGTATGREAGRSLLQPGDVQVWQPWDTLGAVHRFLAYFRPQIGLLMETELWPNLVAESARAGVPLCLVNARLSEKSLRQALRLAWLARPTYRALHAVWAQSLADADRLQQLGAPVRGVFGNFKFDATPNAALLAQGLAWRAAAAYPVLMFASSREGEEAMLLEVLKRNRPLAPVKYAPTAPETIASGVQWLIVPRHPQRFDDVAALFTAAGYTVARRSQWGDTPVVADVWLGDSLGEMALYFGLAQAALLGGSFARLGGQNLIEAAACGVPVFMGPHTYNFAEAAQLAAEAGAAFACADLAQALDRATAMLHDDAALAQAQQAALGLGAAHRGAALRTAQAVAAVLTLSS
ncbi:3-deoxy-D-manno-octulosonic acid transferase [Rhodoferax saidenbachensis]|uniref:3-deoxy-D-manno-octulosonic acid transferase n=1 Tax=Rhodoferax saidenbachensis TaxID=1484693 RepID=A0ABU1ZQZ6_9BURK|nr:3-deoxy-D-manno-octulosonic acid transferase [Rhodoferax saidenbachensis]MDR7307974.1 3-deoxy-D-manno-octulosonic-acid transferase [Rhodoferax saidenbachensis]